MYADTYSGSGLINNAKSIDNRLNFTPNDILCCPPPLCHCFGLVLGFLAVVTHGAKIVFPAESFDAPAVLRAISDEKCTALHGVPTMFEEILNLPRTAGFNCDHLRTGIIAGAPVPRPLMKRLLSELNMSNLLQAMVKIICPSFILVKSANHLNYRLDGDFPNLLQCIHARYR
jgi:acyl-CoA synthetase (AMP-forming)/AMP-acid ligase II